MHKLDINQVYNGDSNLMIKSIESESVDLVIIDPPYKIRKKTDEINSLAKAVKKYNEELQINKNKFHVEIQNDKDTKTIIEIHNKELDMNHLLELSRGETNNV